MRFIDLFAGVGGFHYGLDAVSREKNRRGQEDSQGNDEKGERLESQKGKRVSGEAGRNSNSSPNWANSGPFTCVYSNEWDKYANSVYKKHYGECDDRDIRTVTAEEIPDHDLLCGGFPCQSFSVAGKRGGFDDTRGTLFFEIARIVREKQPRLLLLENVKGLLSHDKGRTFATILTTLDELGYDVQWQVLNSKDFGVPQNRERVFIVGHLRGEPRPKVFPLAGTNQKDIIQLNQTTHSNDRIYGKEGINPTLNTMSGGRRQPKLLAYGSSQDQKLNPIDGLSQTLSAGHFNQPKIIARTVRVCGTGSPHESRQNWDSYKVDGKIRRLTPTECERLQGFPDNYTKYGHDGKPMSDTQRYKMMGNAVTTNVVSAIARKLW